MPALDRYHNAVRNALIKDGWTITAEPLTLKVDDETIFIDIGAEKLIEAEKGETKIGVEVKTFAGPSKLTELEAAMGQYGLYRKILRRTEPDRVLYLAEPEWIVVNRFQQREIWRAYLDEDGVNLIGFDSETEEIVSWLP